MPELTGWTFHMVVYDLPKCARTLKIPWEHFQFFFFHHAQSSKIYAADNKNCIEMNKRIFKQYKCDMTATFCVMHICFTRGAKIFAPR